MDEPVIIESSGNVFADAGLPDAEILLLKAQILVRIDKVIEARGPSQPQAAKLMGATQPDISNLKRGRMRGYGLERLIGFLTALDQDVELVVKPKPKSRKTAWVKGRIAA